MGKGVHVNLQWLSRTLFGLTSGVILGASLCACSAWPYRGSPIKGQVVDGSSGKPLEGVVVVAYWRTETHGVALGIYMDGGGPQDLCDRLANLYSATTGTDGVFQVPAWSATGCLTMYGAQPELIVYKPGYKVQRLLNVDEAGDPATDFSLSYTNGGTVFIWTSSRWDGATIKLVPDRDDAANLSLYFSALSAAVGQVHPSRCFWNEARPAFLSAMLEEQKLDGVYGVQGTPGLHSIADMLRSFYAPHFYQVGDWTCGPMDDYVQGLEKEVEQHAK